MHQPWPVLFFLKLLNFKCWWHNTNKPYSLSQYTKKWKIKDSPRRALNLMHPLPFRCGVVGEFNAISGDVSLIKYEILTITRHPIYSKETCPTFFASLVSSCVRQWGYPYIWVTWSFLYMLHDLISRSSVCRVRLQEHLFFLLWQWLIYHKVYFLLDDSRSCMMRMYKEVSSLPDCKTTTWDVGTVQSESRPPRLELCYLIEPCQYHI